MAAEPVLVISYPLPHVVHLEMNRPSQHNAVDADLHLAMWEAFDAYIADPNLWVLVLSGRGPSFSAGNDLKETNRERERMKAGGPAPAPAMGPGRNKDPSRGFAGWTHHPGLTKPVVAAVHGHALGGGLELAMAADVVVASADAGFGMPETRVGMVAQTGSAQNLWRYIGIQRAMDLLLTGRRISAQTALEWGLVSYTTPAGRENAVKKALEIAALMTEASPDAQRATKALAMFGAETGRLHAQQNSQLPEVKAWLRGDNVREGTAAFKDKRKPNWLPMEKL
ncbi:carnitinyl-CoA dehydratase [Hyaloraphidium curvatum]|nr:carnitinyl-CoA dehydratase [Hyaloraphidium curvatum]